MTEVGPECDIGCYCTGFRLFINIFDSFGFYLFKDATVLNPTGKILGQRDRKSEPAPKFLSFNVYFDSFGLNGLFLGCDCSDL